jgi:FkbM family methyltransferase
LPKLKLLENSIFYVSEESKDIHYQYILRELFELKIYDMPFCPLPSRGVVLDVGANIGMFAYQATAFKNNQVICFEPAENCLPALKKNIESLPNKDKITIIEKGAWSSSGTVNFFEHNEFSGCNQIRTLKGNDTHKIEVTTIDEIVNDMKFNRVDFLKMDIEGAEVEALKGAENTIKTFRPKLALSVYHKPNDEKEIIDLIKSFVDYKVTVVNHQYINIKLAYFY